MNTAQVGYHKARWIGSFPTQGYFLISAVFHYLGPAFAVLLFAEVSVLGVAWLRIAGASVVFAVWRRPWRMIQRALWPQRLPIIAFGLVLAAMNCCFYVAIDRLPLGTVGGIEFLGPIALAVVGSRSGRNLVALLLAIGGVGLLTNVQLSGETIGFVFAFANCALFALYIILGDRLAQAGGERIDRLAAAMLIALVAVTPVGLPGAISSFDQPAVIAAGLGVGVCSSVIPYVCDQLAMARLPRATFALFLSLLPACAATIGFLVLGQVPHLREMLAIAAIVAGIAIHDESRPDNEIPPNNDYAIESLVE